MEVFRRSNQIYIIKKTPDESREIYLDRTNYLIKILNNKNINYDEALKRSYIWRNIKYFKMSYPHTLIKKL